MTTRSARLCIVSRGPFQSGRFLMALHAAVGLQDHLEIIVDRRHGGSPGSRGLREDRRRQPQVDVALEAHGFAIVPASVDPAAERAFPPLPSQLPFEARSSACPRGPVTITSDSSASVASCAVGEVA